MAPIDSSVRLLGGVRCRWYTVHSILFTWVAEGIDTLYGGKKSMGHRPWCLFSWVVWSTLCLYTTVNLTLTKRSLTGTDPVKFASTLCRRRWSQATWVVFRAETPHLSVPSCTCMTLAWSVVLFLVAASWAHLSATAQRFLGVRLGPPAAALAVPEEQHPMSTYGVPNIQHWPLFSVWNCEIER